VKVRARTGAGKLKAWMAGLFLTAVAGFILLPFLQMFVLSLTSTLPRDDIVQWQLSTVNFQNIMTSPLLSGSILNSIIYVTLNVAITIAVALPAAYGISRYRFTGDRHVFLLLIAFRITPPVVLTLPVFLLFAKVGLVNSPLGIALVHCVFNIPIAIWILESFISAVPRELDETAFIDGYSLPRFFVRQLLPLIAPGVGVAAFFCFMFSWVEVVFARILTVTGGKPITMAIDTLYSFRTDIGLVMAMTLVSLIPGVAVIYFVRNHIAKGFIVRS
jgi:glycerol transport system permease protein